MTKKMNIFLSPKNNLKIKTIICIYKSHFLLTLQEKGKVNIFYISQIFLDTRETIKKK